MTLEGLTARDRLIVALDFPDIEDARRAIDVLDGSVGVYKIGLELLFRGGSQLAEELARAGHNVFFDAKLLDIGNTVECSVANIAALGVRFLTIHGLDRKTMTAAVAGRGESGLKLLAVTVMTNLSGDDLKEQGTDMASDELVLHRARMAETCGVDGVVASAHEASLVRAELGPDFMIVTPGIRPAGSDVGDQTRVMTPARAIEAGADYLVIGRPITRAEDPRAAACAIVEEISQA